jgi:hypothetical protein
MAGLVAETYAVQGRALDVVVKHLEIVGLEELGEDAIHFGIGGADKALEIPGLRAAGARLGRRGRRKAEIRGIVGCRLTQNRRKSKD